MTARRLLLAVAVAAGVMLAAGGPAAALTWSTPQAISVGHALNGVACPSLQLCVAVGDRGRVITTSNPTAFGATWHTADVDGSDRLLSVSCAGVTLCVATDNHSRVLASTTPAGGASAWTSAVIDPGRWINAVLSRPSALCRRGPPWWRAQQPQSPRSRLRVETGSAFQARPHLGVLPVRRSVCGE